MSVAAILVYWLGLYRKEKGTGESNGEVLLLLLLTAYITGWGEQSEKGGSAMELQQGTGNGGHRDDGLVFSVFCKLLCNKSCRSIYGKARDLYLI